MQSVERMAPALRRVHELPLAYNVCNQTLREVFKAEHFSLAHVTMEMGATSMLHKHEKFSEIYYLLRGRGILYAGANAYEVSPGSYLVIPPNTPHMLHNNTAEELSHLVIAAPPFDPKDVIMVDEKDYAKPAPVSMLRVNLRTVAQDGANVTELLSKEEQELSGVSLALGELNRKMRAAAHKHREAEEAYYVISGAGGVRVGENNWDVWDDTFVYVPRGNVHALDNREGSTHIRVLCISAPPYRDGDYIPDAAEKAVDV